MRMGNRHSNRDGGSVVSRRSSRKSCPQPIVDASENASGSPVQSTTQPLDTVEQRWQQQMSVDDSNIQPVQLSQYQKTILREAWQRISKKGIGNIGSLIFRRMINRNSEIKKLFQHVTGVEGVFSFGLTPIKVFRHHSVLFVKMLDSAIANLDDLNPFMTECIAYGEKHEPYRQYGFSPDMWDTFGESMTEAAREWEGWKKHREILRAWTILISFIVDRMRQGYESAVRKENLTQQLKLASIDPAEGEEHNEHNASEDPNDNDIKCSKTTPLPRPKKSSVLITSKWRRQSSAVSKKSPVIIRSKSALDVHGE